MTRSRSRVAKLKIPLLLQDKSFIDELATVADAQGMDLETAKAEAATCLEELAIAPRDRYLKWSVRLARFMSSRSYETALDVNTDYLAQLRDMASERPLVFLWSHKSHLDSFVFMRAIYDSGFLPQPLSFAGINMSFAGFGRLARNSGAIFLRRSFAGEDIYKLVFKHYVRSLVQQRAPLSWSIEGTRSRTGKLMPPKPGLLQWVLEALEGAGCDNALLVPVSISFDQIAEMGDYIAINRGEPKRKESLGWFLGYIFGMRSPVGRIHVRFAEAVPVNASPDVTPALVGDIRDPGQAHTRRLALEVSRRIERSNLVTPASLVSTALLAAEPRGLSEQTLERLVLDLLTQVRDKGLPHEPALEKLTEAGLTACLEQLRNTGLVTRAESGRWIPTPGSELGASYYRNTISHYFLHAALAELAVAGLTPVAGENPEDRMATELLEYRKLFKFEFVVKGREDTVSDATAFLQQRHAGWARRLREGSSPFSDRVALFGGGILGSLVEGYLIALRTIGDSAANAQDDRFSDLAQSCMEKGKQMLHSGEIGRASALSLPLFENAVRAISHAGAGTTGTSNSHLQDCLIRAGNALQELDKQLAQT